MTFSIRPQDKTLLKEVHCFAVSQRIELYIVGGYLRDSVLKRQKDNPDIDFCLARQSIKFGRRLAAKIKAGFVALDDERGCCRLIKRINNKTYTLDFADFRAGTLKHDLLHRDFTINCLAVGLEEAINNEDFSRSVIDPACGMQDLQKKTIRAINSKSFDEDPLRILRAFSLSCIFGFKIDKQTLRMIKAKKNKLTVVSQERIRDELFKILARPDSFACLQEMDKPGVLRLVMPEIEVMRGVNQGPYHHLDVFKHSMETLRQLEIIIKEYADDRDVQADLNTVISGDRLRQSLLKLGAFLHDIGKPEVKRRKEGKMIFHGHERSGAEITKIIAKRLKLSNEELDALRKMVFWHLRPGYMGDSKALTARAKFRYFRDAGKEGASVLLLSLADQRSTRGPLTTRASRLRHEKVVSGLIKEYFRRQKEKKVARLVNGNDLMKKFKLKPSPLVGKILSGLEELQATAKIRTKAQAFEAAKKIIKGGTEKCKR
ncbi:MAG: HD domain-containing protein [Candidatus Omnitrophota bacterium]